MIITKENAKSKSEISALIYACKLDDFHSFTALVEEMLDRYANLSHPQPAEVRAEEVEKELRGLFEEAPVDFLGTGGVGHPAEEDEADWKSRIEIALRKVRTISPPPVRHMSDEEIIVETEKLTGTSRDCEFTDSRTHFSSYFRGVKKGLFEYRSFTQSQQTKNA